ncbi:hypothetical protein IscW_ISCW014583 [Ixodes scapularis]|uniref:Uncharacterized protein n=1 Tax=Ixodes scapularis TaxID=6945 RepID=B7QIC7_IXOSC|nr:hypothetical protein IscW_ISCW014583 [Ixodes scapularis]|eukprot:XP_002414934.1 hypothetical protein IscW_ISCW014583 [Ixodes scapularis]
MVRLSAVFHGPLARAAEKFRVPLARTSEELRVAFSGSTQEFGVPLAGPSEKLGVAFPGPAQELGKSLVLAWSENFHEPVHFPTGDSLPGVRERATSRVQLLEAATQRSV